MLLISFLRNISCEIGILQVSATASSNSIAIAVNSIAVFYPRAPDYFIHWLFTINRRDGLHEYQLRPNPAKCTFGATSDKLLGFVVSEKGLK